MALSKKERREMIDGILETIGGDMFHFRDFIMGCVETEVWKWSDNKILGWIQAYGG